jgi:rhamnose transport system permease protein
MVKWALLALRNRVIGVFVFLVLVCTFFTFTSPRFATVSNVNTIVLNASILIILACAEATVVLTRNIDVSIASIVALTAFVGMDFSARYAEIGPVMVLLPVCLGALCGACNGSLVAYVRIPWVIVTLGTLYVFRGLAVVIAGGRQIEPKDLPDWVQKSITGELFWGLSTLLLIALLVVGAVTLFLRYTRIGRQIYAVGSNPDAAVFYGLKQPRIIFQAFVICGALSGLAGYLYGARASYVTPYFFVGLELPILGAVLIGGVSVQGGSGNIFGAALGALVIATIENGIILVGAPEFVRQLIYGLLIVLAVVVDSLIGKQIQARVQSIKGRGGRT